MYKPTYNGFTLADEGSFIISGSSPASVVTYPRARGAVVIPLGVKDADIVLDCTVHDPGKLNSKERLQSVLHERFLLNPTGSLKIEGVTILNCSPTSVNFTYEDNRRLDFTITFEIGSQNTYPKQNKIKLRQLSNYPAMIEHRVSTFTAGCGTFFFGHHTEWLKSASYEVLKKLATSWAYEYNVSHIAGGVEKIDINGWISGARQRELLTFMYNAIFGPLGLSGTLTVGGNKTEHAVFESIKMQKIVYNSMRYTATFTTSLKC